ncbi:hypothetical protein [Paraburkholderia aspalathi]|uniref:hypothetical protein n=1 Tax=Paraburkholderia aspalathi TaxID=1324617 RepID=UPI0038BC5DDD
MMDDLFKGSVLRFTAVTVAIWLGAMAFVYFVGGRASVNQWSALGSLAAPGSWLLSRLARALFRR